MSAATALLVLGNLGLVALLAATFRTDVGGSRAHHDLAYVALAVAGLAAWPLLRRRRLTTLLLASFGAWSLLTGLFLVYVTPGFGHGRWMRWWHGVTSVAFCVLFAAHWARNNPRLVDLARKLARSRAASVAFAGAWALGALAVAASVATPLSDLFTDGGFHDLASLSFALVAVALLYAALLTSHAGVRRMLERTDSRNRLRGGLDASLLAATWLAALTGFPLLWFSRDLRALDAYWLVAGWHVVASALLVGLVLTHATLNRRPLRAHLR